MEELTIQPGYEIPIDEPDIYDKINTAVEDHNALAKPGEAYWGIRIADSKYSVYEYGEVPQPPTEEELADRLKYRKETKIEESKMQLSEYLASNPLI